MPVTLNKQQQIYVAGGLGALLLAVLAGVLLWKGQGGGLFSCATKKIVVEGTDMAPAFAEGDPLTFTLLHGDEDCASASALALGDVVLFQTATPDRQVPLFVKALPGMKLALREEGEKGAAILVDDVAVTNSQGEVVYLGEARARMLQLYIDGYKGAVPESAHLLLGDNPQGAYDSSRLGLLDSRDFVGVLKPGKRAADQAPAQPAQ